MKGYRKGSVQKFFGYFLLFAGIFFLIVGIGMLVDPDKKDRDTAPSIIIFSNVFTIPGAILLIQGKKNNRLQSETKSLAALVQTYRRITLRDLAGKLGTTESRAEFLLSRAISMNLVEGNFDRTTGEFFTLDSMDEKAKLRFCPSCGAPLDKVYLAGETIKCGACGAIFS